MKLIGCYIENFGKLSNASFSFDEGCNVICQENGWGKSTLAAFIKVMLYGFDDDRSRDDLKNERRRYKPWQGGVYGGRLEFEADGTVYVITRVFGAKEKDDKFNLRRKDTNLESNDYSSQVGEELFQLDCRSFCRTVFISQSDCETTATDGINAKIGNLAEDTGDINNYETVNRTLTDLLNQMSPTRKTGSINKMRDEIVRLEESVRAGRNVSRTMEDVNDRLGRQLAEQKALKEEQAELLERQKKISAYKDVQAKQEKYTALCQEYEARKGNADERKKYFPGKVPEQSELEQYIAESSKLAAAVETVNLYRLTESEERNEQELGQLFGGAELSAEEMKGKEEQIRQLQEIQLEMARQQLSPAEQEAWEEYESRFSGGVPDQQELEKVLEDWSSCIEKKNVLNQKKVTYETLRGVAQMGVSVSQNKTQNGGRRSNASLVGFLICVIFGAVAAVAGLFLPGAFSVALPVAGILLIVFGIFLLFSGRKSSSAAQTEQPEENNGLGDLQREIEEDEAFIERAEQDTARFLKENGIRCDRDGEILDRLYGLKADIREYSTLDRKRNLSKTGELDGKYKELLDDLRKFFSRYYPGEIVKETELSDRLEQLKTWHREYQRLKEKRENFETAVKNCGLLSHRLQDYVSTLSLTPEKDLHGQLQEIQRHLQLLNTALQEFAAAKKRKEEFERAENMETILQEKPTEDMEEMEVMNDRLEDISMKLEKIYEYITDYNRQLDGLREESDQVTEDEEALNALREEYNNALIKYKLLEKTRDFMEQAKVSFTAKYTAPLRESFGKYYEMMTREKPERFHMDANSNVTVDEQGMQREPRFFSAGVRDLIGVCMRMALVDAMYQEDRPFVIFDDPFANLDGRKLEGALRFLEEIGKEYQVLYFTCHESRAAG